MKSHSYLEAIFTLWVEVVRLIPIALLTSIPAIVFGFILGKIQVMTKPRKKTKKESGKNGTHSF